MCGHLTVFVRKKVMCCNTMKVNKMSISRTYLTITISLQSFFYEWLFAKTFMSKQGGHVYTPFSRKENFLSFNFSQKTWQVWHFKYLGMGKLLLFFISIAIYWRTFTKEKSIPSTNFSTFNSLSNKAFWKIKLIDDAMEKVTGFL